MPSPVTLENAAKVFALIVSAQGIITCGVYFISGMFMPHIFGGLYAATGATARLVIALITAFSIGNVLMAYAFAHFSPALTAPLTIFSIVLMQIGFAVWIFKLHPSPWLLLATLAVALSCTWVSLLLNQQPAS